MEFIKKKGKDRKAYTGDRYEEGFHRTGSCSDDGKFGKYHRGIWEKDAPVPDNLYDISDISEMLDDYNNTIRKMQRANAVSQITIKNSKFNLKIEP